MKGSRTTNEKPIEVEKIDELELNDIGGMDMPDLDVALFDIQEDEADSENRYSKPKVYNVKSEFVMYDNAVKLAKELRMDYGERSDVFVSGSFIFGDFIEAYLTTHHAKAKKMTISTLSLSQNNVESLHNLLKCGYIEELNLIVSVYFYGNEIRSLIPYIYRQLDIDNRFQLAVAGIHTKTCQFETLGGRKMLIHGSANLRSSGNIEQFTIEENPELYDFYDDAFAKIIGKYATIKKPVRNKQLWEEFIKMKFND